MSKPFNGVIFTRRWTRRWLRTEHDFLWLTYSFGKTEIKTETRKRIEERQQFNDVLVNSFYALIRTSN